MIDPLGDGTSSVQLIQHVGSDKMIVHSARISYANDRDTPFDPERDYKLIRFLLKHSHGTPFEHNLITYRITAPLYVIQELLRHRVGVSVNQESRRYVQTDPVPFVPPAFRVQAKSNKQASLDDTEGVIDQQAARELYERAVQSACEAYEALLAMGVARELARGVLPHCTYSSLYVTFNLRSLFHFLSLRSHRWGGEGAQVEISRYADAFHDLAEPLFPETFRAFREVHALDGPSG